MGAQCHVHVHFVGWPQLGGQHVHTFVHVHARQHARVWGAALLSPCFTSVEYAMHVPKMRLACCEWPCLQRFREGMQPYTVFDARGEVTRTCAHSAAVVTQYSSIAAAYFRVCGEKCTASISGVCGSHSSHNAAQSPKGGVEEQG